MKITIQELKGSEIIFVNVTLGIAERAGELRLKYDIPTADSMIAATGIVENVKHVLTNDTRHFGRVKNLIKIKDIKKVLDMT